MSKADEEKQRSPKGPLPLTAAPRSSGPSRALTDRPPQAFETVDRGAAKLGLEAGALRARCRRAAVAVGDTTVAHLGGGIVAFKFGRSWRLRFPPALELPPSDAMDAGFDRRPSAASERTHEDEDSRDSIAGRFVPVARQEESE